MNLRRSLRLRLLLAAAGSIVLALVIAGAFILTSFSASLEAARRDDLAASLDRLIAAIDPDNVDLAGQAPLADPRYDTPLSGVYWQIDDRNTGRIVRSRSLWDQELPVAQLPGSPDGTLAEVEGPDGKPLIALVRDIVVQGATGSRHLRVAIAEARSQDDDPFFRFGTDLVGALIVLGIVLVLAAAAQIQFILRPLSTLRQQISDTRHGATARLPPARVDELEPVVAQINDLLDAQEESITFARQRAADLAHGLKTPLAVLGATAERLRAGGDAANADLMQMLSEQMHSRIDYQLHIARLRLRTRAQGASSSLKETVLRTVSVLRKSVNGEHLNWLVDLEDDLRVDLDGHDLMELGGILLENAAKWAAGEIRVNGGRDGSMVQFVVEDDGVGVSDDLITRLGVRGARLDESMPGEGLGLSIAFEIVRLNRGTIAVDRSRIGGLRVTVALPQA
jgi:signal transduction histidine kinase